LMNGREGWQDVIQDSTCILAVSCALSPYELCVMPCCLHCRAVLCVLLSCVLCYLRCHAVFCALLSCVLCFLLRLLAFLAVLPSMPCCHLCLVAFVAVLSSTPCCLRCRAVLCALLSCVLCCPRFSLVWFVVLSCMLYLLSSMLPRLPRLLCTAAFKPCRAVALASGRTIPVSQTQELEAAL